MIKREDVKLQEKWDLSAIFKSEKEFKIARDELVSKAEKFVEDYEGKIKDSHTLNKALDDLKIIYELEGKVWSYSFLQLEVDILTEENNRRVQETNQILAKVSSKLSFFELEVSNLDKEILEEAKSNEENRRWIEKTLRNKPYQLGKDVEEALSFLSTTLEYPSQGYNDTKFKDLKFSDVKINNKTYPMTYNSFEEHMEYEIDTDLRREAFKVFSEGLDKYVHTTASQYNAQVQKEKSISELRGFDSVFDYLLFPQEVTREMYDRQIDVIMKELAPHMRKYAKILGKIHNLDEVRYSDLKIELDPEYSPSVTIDEAKNYIVDGLSILGEDYQNMLERAFSERWIDYAENLGKRTGAFCAFVYGVHPYVMTSFNGKMSQVITLSHELGHAGNSCLEGKAQNILNTGSSSYFIESPSTTNELIMENYLLDKAIEEKDLRMERWVLSQMISKTYYHNFVTHFMEAAYQREVYKLVDQGKSLDAENLNKIFKDKLVEFWGEDVILDKGAELTWMRQPHYYMGLYSYTYSAGLTIGTQVAREIREKGEPAAKMWLEALKQGGSKKPEEIAMMVGVDVSTDKPLKDTISYIGSIIDRIEEISIELGDIK